MTFDTLLKIGQGIQKIHKRSSDLYQNYKIDLVDYEDEYSVIIDSLLNEVFTKSQKDMFDWFCYESDFGEKEDFHAYDKNGNIICDTWENLYKTLEEYEIEF